MHGKLAKQSFAWRIMQVIAREGKNNTQEP
jgi:hypothetical protein